MNSIVLTPAELAQVPSGVIVTPGDRRRHRSIKYIARPVRWTALEGPCETCGGSGTTRYEVPPGSQYGVTDWMPCPDCVNGRKRIELRKPDPAYYSAPHSFSLLVARASVEVLPVVCADAYGNGSLIVFKDGEHVEADEHMGTFHSGTWHWYPVPLNGLPVPGRDWVVILSDVEPAS